jgi:hypothetical protein
MKKKVNKLTRQEAGQELHRLRECGEGNSVRANQIAARIEATRKEDK